MIDAYIGLGSNIENPRQQLLTAIEALECMPQTAVRARSALYSTAPVGSVEQPDFVNAVVQLETDLAAIELLVRLQGIEKRQGRQRDGQRWGPRTLDLDLLLYGDSVINTETLQVPHPRMHQRPFVMYPLLELSPQLQIPGHGDLQQLLEGLSAAGIERLTL